MVEEIVNQFMVAGSIDSFYPLVKQFFVSKGFNLESEIRPYQFILTIGEPAEAEPRRLVVDFKQFGKGFVKISCTYQLSKLPTYEDKAAFESHIQECRNLMQQLETVLAKIRA